MRYWNSEHIISFSTERHCIDPAASYDGFNVTHYCGDDSEHVSACRQELCRELGISESHLIVPRQVHGVHIEEVTEQNIGMAFAGESKKIPEALSMFQGFFVPLRAIWKKQTRYHKSGINSI